MSYPLRSDELAADSVENPSAAATASGPIAAGPVDAQALTELASGSSGAVDRLWPTRSDELAAESGENVSSAATASGPIAPGPVDAQTLTDLASGSSGAVGGAALKLSLEEAVVHAAPLVDVEVLDLHNALNDLAELDTRQARIVELRYFGGMTVPEVAEVLEVSVSTVESSWAHGRAWLRLRLEAS